MLFHGWLHNANSEDLYRYQREKDREPAIQTDDENNFRNAGYSTTQIETIKQELRKAGYDA